MDLALNNPQGLICHKKQRNHHHHHPFNKLDLVLNLPLQGFFGKVKHKVWFIEHLITWGVGKVY